MSEDTIKRKCVKIAKKTAEQYAPHFWFYCPTDRFVSGIPDICICYKGQWAVVELKTERGKVTPIQEHTMKKLRDAGCVTEVCRSGEKFAEFLLAFMMNVNGKGVI